MNFIKENSRTITSMVANQIGMTVFGLVLSMATHTNETIFLLTSVFAIGLYMVLLYMLTWEVGAKDSVRISGGRMSPMPLKGLYLSLVANSVNIILAIMLNIGYIAGGASDASAEWASNLYHIPMMIASAIQGMYAGVRYVFMPQNPLAYILMVVPALAVCALGYYLGSIERSISGMLGIRKNKKD